MITGNDWKERFSNANKIYAVPYLQRMSQALLDSEGEDIDGSSLDLCILG